ncbi:MAG TPA: hypothetical protein VN493_06005 [Thermoanaerobaculia bacterium]|nr:hypothetical protein [Thermoanaerobaculia bacterium]
MAELVYRPEEGLTSFVVGQGREWEEMESLELPGGEVLVPFSPQNNLLVHGVVLLPSEPVEYGTEEELRRELSAFLHRYIDLSPEFAVVAREYILFTWLYDSFNEVPYLRVRGDYGSGKSRFLLSVGSLCYLPIFASGASTMSPLFRIMDIFRGTLVLDEGDFRASDEKAEIVKMLNNGMSRGFPVLRTEQTASKEFNPRAFHVFGPKVLATRGFFEDRALESRCISEVLGNRPIRSGIPLNLSDDFKREALSLRNKLLLYRIRTRAVPREVDQESLPGVEPRLAQIFRPLLATSDPASRGELLAAAQGLSGELRGERLGSVEGEVLEVLRDLWEGSAFAVAVKDVTAEFGKRHGEEYEWKVTSRWIGNVLRKKLFLSTVKSNGNFVVPRSEGRKLRHLLELYGLSDRFGDDGDVGEVAESGGEEEIAGTDAA